MMLKLVQRPLQLPNPLRQIRPGASPMRLKTGATEPFAYPKGLVAVLASTTKPCAWSDYLWCEVATALVGQLAFG